MAPTDGPTSTHGGPGSDTRALWLVRQVAPHEQALRAWLASRQLPGLEIDDIVQETYSKLMTTTSVDHVWSVKTYLFQAAWSVLISHVRRAKIIPFQAMSEAEELTLELPDPSPETVTRDRDELRRLVAVIHSLPPRARQVFVLKRVHDLPSREVAARLAITEGVVEKHMTRAIEILMAEFGRGGTATSRALKGRNRQTPAHEQAADDA